jgi:hypothetical protein
MPRIESDGPFGDEEYEREGGVLVPVNIGHEVRHEDETIAPDDVLEDLVADEGVPGTPDDLPYDYGVELSQPADQMMLSVEQASTGFGAMGVTGSDEDEDEPPLGLPEEHELWRRQKPLIQESDEEAGRDDGLQGDDVARLEAAVGEDAGEVLPETPEGESATGSV